MNFFDIHYSLFNVFGYALSLIELIAVVTGLVAVYLASRGKVINFYIGLVNNVLYFILFYQFQLYSMMLLQAVYFCISSYGIYSWSHGHADSDKLKISKLSTNQRLALLVVIGVAGVAWGYGVRYFSGLYPEHIEQPTYPIADALLTVASVVGQILLTRKKLDNWMLWIVVNICSIVLYAFVGIYFTMALYVIYLIIAISAYIGWTKMYKAEPAAQMLAPKK